MARVKTEVAQGNYLIAATATAMVTARVTQQSKDKQGGCREAKSKQAEVSKIRESNVSTLANRLVCFDISILKRSLKYTNQQRITKP